MLTEIQCQQIIKKYIGENMSPKNISYLLKLDYEDVKKYITKIRKKPPKTKSDGTLVQTAKQKNWYNWKASCLISSFQRRHKEYKIPYNFLTVRKEYEETIRKVLTQNCEYCGVKLTKSNLSVDHKTPLVRGGDTSHSNLAYCCSNCNSEKGNLTDIEFKQLKALLNTWNDKGSSLLKRLRAAGNMFNRNWRKKK